MATHYEAPHLSVLLTVSSFLYLVNVAEALFEYLINAGLIGSLAVGIIYGPQVSDILPEPVQHAFIILGYVGLVLLVFEAGLSTNITLLFNNIILSVVTAFSGIVLPIAFSLLLLHVGYGYSVLQAFGAGAALCSTSLGITLALLQPDLRRTRAGTVLLSAALLDDIVGLVIAAIIQELPATGGASSGIIIWPTIVRPILVSFGFAFLTPAFAVVLRVLLRRLPNLWSHRVYTVRVQLLVVVAGLSGFVAGAKYAGTSELFGAYLAGALITHVFAPPPQPGNGDQETMPQSYRNVYSPADAFAAYLLQPLQLILSPVFFASIGAALPIRSLVSINGSYRVVWRGILYSLLMVISKAAVGLWMLIWPSSWSRRHWFGSGKRREIKTQSAAMEAETSNNPVTYPTYPTTSELSLPRATALIGFAMVARGEIALTVAQLARPLLVNDSTDPSGTSEPFAVVIWAIFVSTIGGAIGVGFLLRMWARSS